MATIIIEELSRGYKLIARHKFSNNTVGIGRSYQNDIIINDPHVCPEHLSLQFDGEQWLIQDLNSVNGSFIGDKKASAHHHIVQSGDIITLGNSLVRLVFPDHPVAPSAVQSQFEQLINMAKHPLAMISFISVFALVNAFLVYLATPVEIQLQQLIAPVLKAVLTFAIWPLGVALVAHLTKNDARIWAQIGISFLLFNVFWLVDFGENILRFNAPNSMLTSLLVMAIPAGLAFCLFWLNIYTSFHMSAQRRNMTAIGLVVLFFGGGTLLEFSKKPDFDYHPRYDATMMSPNYLYRSSQSIEKFLHDSNDIFIDARNNANEKHKT